MNNPNMNMMNNLKNNMFDNPNMNMMNNPNINSMNNTNINMNNNNNLNMNMLNNSNMNMMNNTNINMDINPKMNLMNNSNMNMMNNINTNMINNPSMNMFNYPNMNIMNDFKNMMNNSNIMDNDNMNNFEDVYPYIKENKIGIILKGINNINNEKKYILIPSSLKKNELYYTAKKFRNIILDSNIYSEIKLYHNNKLLNNDDSSIEFLLNGDLISVKSDTNFNSLYYQSILEIYKDSPKINITFRFTSGYQFNLVLPDNISLKQMFKIFFKEMNLEKNKYSLKFLYDGETMNTKDDRILKNIFGVNSTITIFNTGEVVPQNYIDNNGPGKVFEVSIENNKGIILDFKVGTLEQISNFRKRLNGKAEELKYKINNNPILYPGNIEVKEDCERTFSSIGIRDDCICKLDLSEI